MSVAPIVLAPGQGAQTAGMGLSWAETSEEARNLLDEADAILAGNSLPGGSKLSDLMRAGGDVLDRTDVAQPALFVAGAMALAGGGLVSPTSNNNNISAAAGLSLGEYTALYAAGALSFSDGVRLVSARGAAMQAAAEKSDGGMVAVVGSKVTDAVARQICEVCSNISNGELLVPANFNCPGQVVLSGAKAAVVRASKYAKEQLGLRAPILDVAGAFHSPFMQPAADTLAAELAKTTFRPLKCVVVSNVTGAPFEDHNIADNLARGLVTEVRWEKCLRYLLAQNKQQGAEFVELAPGKTIAGMMRKIDRKTKVGSLDAPVAEASAI